MEVMDEINRRSEIFAREMFRMVFRQTFFPEQVCVACFRSLPIEAFGRHVTSRRRTCRGCEWRARFPVEIPVQQCARCNRHLTFDQFGRTGKVWRRTCIQCADQNLEAASRSCSKCGETKPGEEFRINKNRHGKVYLSGSCLSCTRVAGRDRMQKYRTENPEKANDATYKWRRENRERYLELKTAERDRRAIRNGKNPPSQRRAELEKTRSLRISDEERALDAAHVRALRKIASKSLDFRGWTDVERAAWLQLNDPQYAINQRMRVQIRKAMRGGKAGRRWEELVGYTVGELVAHIERQLPRGWTIKEFFDKGWHIDHIIPKSSFDVSNPDELRACWCLSNLRPLPAKANISKGKKRTVLL